MTKNSLLFLFSICGAVFVVSTGYSMQPDGSPAATQTALTGDAVAGKKGFRRCAACHSFDPEKRKAGPHLKNLIGRPAGDVEGFTYSPAMKNSGIVWTDEALLGFLENPRKTVPGTSMVTRIRDLQKRADIVAYLNQQNGDAVEPEGR